MRRTVAIVFALSVISNCERQATGPSVSRPQFRKVGSGDNSAIFDGAHNNWNRHFFFLPPLVDNPTSTNGEFDPSLAPVVQVCEWTGTECRLPLVAEFTTRSGGGSETVRVDGGEQHYVLDWHTGRSRLDPAKTYRIAAVIGPTDLGYAYARPTDSEREGISVPGDVIGFINGRALPIKFRIEKGALPISVSPISGDGQVAPEGHPLQHPLIVKTTNERGEAIPGVLVQFSLVQGGGTLSQEQSRTDPLGQAQATLFLGRSGLYVTEADVHGLDPAFFSAGATTTRLSAEMPVLHLNPGDPVILTAPAGDGDVVQLLGPKDSQGVPASVTGVRVFTLATPDETDILAFDSEGRPTFAALRDGSRVFFDYPAASQVNVTFVLKDGTAQTVTGQLTSSAPTTLSPSSTQTLASVPRQVGSASPATFDDPSGAVVNVRAFLADERGQPLTKGFAVGTWDFVFSPTVEGSPSGFFVMDELAPDLWGRTLTWPLVDLPISRSTFYKVCGLATADASAACEGLKVLKSFACSTLGPKFEIACSLLLSIGAKGCAVAQAPLSVLCPLAELLTASIPELTGIRFTVYAGTSGKNCSPDPQSEVVSPPFAETISFHFTCTSGGVRVVVVSPDPLRLVVGATGSLTATALDGNGSAIPNLDFVWARADGFSIRLLPIPGVTDRIDVKADGAGLAQVTATVEHVSGVATVDVLPFEARWTGSRTIAGSGGSDTRQLVCGLSGELFDFRVSCNEPGGRLVVFSIIATNLTATIEDSSLEPNQVCVAPVNLSGATMSGSGRCTAGQTVDYSLTRSPD